MVSNKTMKLKAIKITITLVVLVIFCSCKARDQEKKEVRPINSLAVGKLVSELDEKSGIFTRTQKGTIGLAVMERAYFIMTEKS